MHLNTLLFFAQAAPTTTRVPDQNTTMMVWMLFAFALVYFITIRPQQKRQKQLQAQISATKTGDRVVTSGGIYGIIANVKEKTFMLKIADNVKIEIDKAAVTTVLKSSEAPAAPDSNA